MITSSKQTKLFKKNQIIYNQNDNVENIYWILDGIVNSINTNKIKENFTLEKGNSLGLIDLILRRPFSRKMVAKSTVSLAVLEKEKIEKILNKNKLTAVLIRSLAINIDNNYPNTWS